MLIPATGASVLFQRLQWRLWLFQLLLWALLLPAYTSWSLAVFALLLLAKMWQLYRGGRAWSLTRSNLLAVGMLAVLLLSARQLGVMHLMFHFLLLAAILRLLGLDASRRTDVTQLLWVHYFLLACAFILHQDLWLAVVILLGFVLNLSAHHLAFCRVVPDLHWRRLWPNALLAVLASALLFVAFPRLPPLWQLPGAKLTQTGLGDDLAPGNVSELLQSNALAFRVRFDGMAPPADARYFRAKIYEAFDGETWRAQRPQPRVWPDPGSNNTVLRYSIIAEPHQQFSLFALGLPRQHSSNVATNREWLIVAEQPVSQRISYQLSSELTPLPATGSLQRYLQLPEGNPQARKLAAQLAAGAPGARELVQRIGLYFRTQQFRYSLSPGQIAAPHIDNFLFDHKRGFCSHYAGSSVFLLRAAGVPARLIGGYLGGDWQDDGAYLQVLQKDAHAWVEYFAEGHWQLFDPTALVEPALWSEQPAGTAVADFNGFRGDWLVQRLELWLLQPLRNMDYYWSMWVLGFDSAQQQGLFTRLQAWQQQLRWQGHYVFWLVLPAGLALWWWWRRRRETSATAQLFAPLLRLEAKPAGQSYQQYLQHWMQLAPQHAGLLRQCLQDYLAWQFGGDPAAFVRARRTLQQLLPALKRLKS